MNKRINTEKVDGFFYTASKALIFIPVAAIVVALLFKLSGTNANPTTNNLSVKVTPTEAAKKESIAFDLKGPYICIYKEGKTEAKAYVKNKRVLATVVENGAKSTYRLEDDCLYVNGNKTCNMAPYIIMFESLLKNDVSGLAEMWGKYSKTKINLRDALKTCKKESFEDTVFD